MVRKKKTGGNKPVLKGFAATEAYAKLVAAVLKDDSTTVPACVYRSGRFAGPH